MILFVSKTCFIESYEIDEYVFRDAVRRMAQLFHDYHVTCDDRMHDFVISCVLGYKCIGCCYLYHNVQRPFGALYVHDWHIF